MSDLERSLLDFVRRDGYRPLKPRQLAKQLGLDEAGASELKRVIKRLVNSGKLSYGANHLVAASAPKPARRPAHAEVVGVFRRTEQGFGFVRPEGSLPGADKSLDIYIAAADTRDAASGDTVLVKLRAKRVHRRPNPEGVIAEIVARETHQFVGTYFEAAGQAFVQIDGTVFSQPVAVGDPGAKNAQPDDKVVIEMVRFPSHVHAGEGVITGVLGPRGAPGVDTASIIHEYGLPLEFPADVLAAARAEADKFDESISHGRRDLMAETIVTIDPVDARDFDDAISLARTARGHWLLGVHIADVAHFVRPKSPLDREAHHRATSVYLPDRVLPMLPETISNSLASLQPGKVRYAKTCQIEFTADGVPVATDTFPSAIRSCHRFTYEDVDAYLAHREAWKKKLPPEVHALVGRMHELAMILLRRRLERGSLELSLREVKVDLDKDGRVTGAHVVENTESHQIIEEFMLAANEAVARALAHWGVSFLRRVHQPPDLRKLQALTEFVVGLGFAVDSLESRFELQKLLALVAGTPQSHAVNYALLRSLQRAVYSPAEEGHFALASDCYCHFTSPIRRYPDLTVHRLLEAMWAKKKPALHFGELAVLGGHCSDRERRAEEAERELTKVKLLEYLSTRLGEQLDGVITGVEEFGFFVQGIELPAEGLVHVMSLADDYYRFDRAAHTLAGTRSGNAFRLGDRVRVEVARVDVERRELDLRLVGGLAGPRAARRRPHAPAKKPTKHPRKVARRHQQKQRRRK